MSSIAEHIQGHRAVADFLARHIEFLSELPNSETVYDDENVVWRDGEYCHADTGERISYIAIYSGREEIIFSTSGPKAKELMTAIRRELGGKWEKQGNGNTFSLRQQDRPDGLTIDIDGPRDQVCKARQVGTRTVQRVDPKAPRIEVEEPVIEWDCDPMLIED